MGAPRLSPSVTLLNVSIRHHSRRKVVFARGGGLAHGGGLALLPVLPFVGLQGVRLSLKVPTFALLQL